MNNMNNKKPLILRIVILVIAAAMVIGTVAGAFLGAG